MSGRSESTRLLWAAVSSLVLGSGEAQVLRAFVHKSKQAQQDEGSARRSIEAFSGPGRGWWHR